MPSESAEKKRQSKANDPDFFSTSFKVQLLNSLHEHLLNPPPKRLKSTLPISQREKQQSKANDPDFLERFPDSLLERYATERHIPETSYTHGVLLWNTPMSMSQSRLGDRSESEACALIALKMAEYLTHYDVQFPYIGSKLYLGEENAPKNTSDEIRSFPSYLPEDVLGVYVKAILEGNDLCDQEKETRTVKGKIGVKGKLGGFTIEDAFKVTQFKMRYIGISQEVLTYDRLQKFLTESIDDILKDDKTKDWNHIFFLFGAKHHCTLIVYQPKNRMFAFIDSSHHRHHHYLTWRAGGTLVLSKRQDLPNFCSFLKGMFFGGEFRLFWAARNDEKIENWEPSRGMLAHFDLIPKPRIPEPIMKLDVPPSTKKPETSSLVKKSKTTTSVKKSKTTTSRRCAGK